MKDISRACFNVKQQQNKAINFGVFPATTEELHQFKQSIFILYIFLHRSVLSKIWLLKSQPDHVETRGFFVLGPKRIGQTELLNENNSQQFLITFTLCILFYNDN